MVAKCQKEQKGLLRHIKPVYKAVQVSPDPVANFSPLVSFSALLLSLQHLRSADVRRCDARLILLLARRNMLGLPLLFQPSCSAYQ